MVDDPRRREDLERKPLFMGCSLTRGVVVVRTRVHVCENVKIGCVLCTRPTT